MAQEGLLYAEKVQVLGKISTDNGNFTTDGTSGNVTAVALTASGNVLLSNKKLGASAAGDIMDLSGAQGIYKLGPTSTTLKLAVAMTTNNFVDNNSNQINSGGTKIAASANGAIAHGYAGTLTPTVINTTLTVAGTVIWGTIGTTNATITMSVAGAFTAQAQLV